MVKVRDLIARLSCSLIVAAAIPQLAFAAQAPDEQKHVAFGTECNLPSTREGETVVLPRPVFCLTTDDGVPITPLDPPAPIPGVAIPFSHAYVERSLVEFMDALMLVILGIDSSIVG